MAFWGTDHRLHSVESIGEKAAPCLLADTRQITELTRISIWLLLCILFGVRYFLFLLLVLLALPAHAAREKCGEVSEAVKTLQKSKDPEARSRVGTCLVRAHLGDTQVARTVLNILRDPSEDVLLKEDLIEAFANCTLRRKVRVDQKLLPEETAREERETINRNLGSVGRILATAEAVKGMDETIPVTQFEADFFRALSDIALDEQGHVLLRASAVSALERLNARVVSSGIYHEKSVRLARETLRTLASRDDDIAYVANASNGANSRMISSVNK